MNTLELTEIKMRQGVWEGIVSGSPSKTPTIEVTHLDKPVADVALSERDPPGQWVLQVPIPKDAIADGVQTFLIIDSEHGVKLGHFSIIAGEALGADMRTEIELLRAELDMLKRAFRRHCIETK